MHILITGAGGFIGSHLLTALLREGHQVTAAVRSPESINGRFPGVRALTADFSQMHKVADWMSLLESVDVVINAVGIIRETGHQRFSDLHERAPIVLFEAARRAGVRRIIQISALGSDEQAASRYHLSKRAADDHLARMDIDWVILRPSIVYGPGARSMALFKAMASLPCVPLIGQGEQPIQPIHVQDLTRAVLTCLDEDAPSRTRVDLVGAEPVRFSGLMTKLRRWLGLPPPRFLRLPYTLALQGARLGGFLGGAPVNAETVEMLQRGNEGDVTQFIRHFGFTPRSLDQALADEPANEADRWHAGLYLLKPLLLLSIAFTWIAAGVTSGLLYPAQHSLALLASAGIQGPFASVLLYGGAGLDLLLGLACLFPRTRRLSLLSQLVVMAIYTAIISLLLPQLWLEPFGPVVKNLPLAVATLCLLVMERTPRWNT